MSTFDCASGSPWTNNANETLSDCLVTKDATSARGAAAAVEQSHDDRGMEEQAARPFFPLTQRDASASATCTPGTADDAQPIRFTRDIGIAT